MRIYEDRDGKTAFNKSGDRRMLGRQSEWKVNCCQYGILKCCRRCWIFIFFCSLRLLRRSMSDLQSFRTTCVLLCSGRKKKSSTRRCVWWEPCHMILMVCHFGETDILHFAATTVAARLIWSQAASEESERSVESQLHTLNSNLLLFFHYVSFSSRRILYLPSPSPSSSSSAMHAHSLAGRLRLKPIWNEKKNMFEASRHYGRARTRTPTSCVDYYEACSLGGDRRRCGRRCAIVINRADWWHSNMVKGSIVYWFKSRFLHITFFFFLLAFRRRDFASLLIYLYSVVDGAAFIF